jgi:DNA-directed RNA polymerase specialized sigma24 family protein
MSSSTTQGQVQPGGVRRLAESLYMERRTYLLAIARRNCVRDANAEEALHDAFAAFIEHYDPAGSAPPLAWLSLTLKRRCWRIRQEARAAAPLQAVVREDGELVEETSERGVPGPDERVVDLEEAWARLRGLKADQRAALALQASGYSYREIGKRRGWTYTKVNRSITEGRAALRAAG